MIAEQQREILAIDFRNLVSRFYFVSPDGSDFLIESLKYIMKKSFQYNSKFIILIDDAGLSNREVIYPAYKMQREFDEGREVAINECSKYYQEAGLKFLTVPPYEADDVILSLSCAHEERVAILSKDRDMLHAVYFGSLVDWGTIKTEEGDFESIQFYTDEGVVDKTGFTPYFLPVMRFFLGKTSDNLNLFPGVGKSFLQKALEAEKATSLDPEEIYQRCMAAYSGEDVGPPYNTKSGKPTKKSQAIVDGYSPDLQEAFMPVLTIPVPQGDQLEKYRIPDISQMNQVLIDLNNLRDF